MYVQWVRFEYEVTARSYFGHMELLVGIGHQMRSGKDTVAEILIEERGFTRFAFADVLREYAYRINPVVLLSRADLKAIAADQPVGNAVDVATEDEKVQPLALNLAAVIDVAGWEKAKAVQGVRRILQELGHHGREVIGKDVWVDALFNAVEVSEAERVVISDVRYDNEAKRITTEGGINIHVRRDAISPSEDTAGHPSEHGLSDGWADQLIVNDGTVEELKVKVLSMVDGFSPSG